MLRGIRLREWAQWFLAFVVPVVAQTNFLADTRRTACNAFMARIGCSWTSRWNCPGQLRGSIGEANETDSLGYMCCCKCELWRRPWSKPLPIIIDTDIGDDFDDSWALAMAISSPGKWDVKMILTAAKDTVARAQIVAKYLYLYKRTDIPIGIGLRTQGSVGALFPWAADMSLENYTKSLGGTVYQDGIQAVANLLNTSPEPITFVELAPVTNLFAIIKQYPSVVRKVERIYAMFGAVDFCYDLAPISVPGSCSEFNVAQDILAAQHTLAAAWNLTITPLDTCAIKMTGEPWQRLEAASQAGHFIALPLIESLRVWNPQAYPPGCQQSDFLYDAVAMYTSYSQTLFRMQELQLQVTNTGATVRNSLGRHVIVASNWNSGGLSDFLWELMDMIIAAQPGLHQAGVTIQNSEVVAFVGASIVSDGKVPHGLQESSATTQIKHQYLNEVVCFVIFAGFSTASIMMAFSHYRRALGGRFSNMGYRSAMGLELVGNTLHTSRPWPSQFPTAVATCNMRC